MAPPAGSIGEIPASFFQLEVNPFLKLAVRRVGFLWSIPYMIALDLGVSAAIALVWAVVYELMDSYPGLVLFALFVFGLARALISIWSLIVTRLRGSDSDRVV